MKTILWLAILFSVLSFLVICVNFYANKDGANFEHDIWPYPLLLACLVIVLTIEV